MPFHLHTPIQTLFTPTWKEKSSKFFFHSAQLIVCIIAGINNRRERPGWRVKQMKTKIGTITLKHWHEFTQYGEHAAWTDYVTCEPQTVDLFLYDSGYWVGASFAGTLTRSSYPSGSRFIGKPASAFMQTQAWGGIGDWLDCDLVCAEITNPDYSIEKVGTYTEGCTHPGAPILALRKQALQAV